MELCKLVTWKMLNKAGGYFCPNTLLNFYAAGMLVTSDRRAHMSTRNTVCSRAQGQATGTAAALWVEMRRGSREPKHADLRGALTTDGVYFEG